MQELCGHFVCAADEVGRLQRAGGEECELFREIAEQGHFAGRTKPTNTRQGIYAAAPSGKLLASINTRDPRKMSEMLERALAVWKDLPREERLLPRPLDAERTARQRFERVYPEDGLVLRVSSRDLPREGQPADWRMHASNLDYAWFTAEEARSMVPAPEVGARAEVDAALLRRLATLHLVDNVRGQVSFFKPEHVKDAELELVVTEVTDGALELTLAGRSRTHAKGRWPVDGYRDRENPTEQERGFDAQLLGRATWDRARGAFTRFELVALGTRFGGTQYNGRGDDLDPAPMGTALVLYEGADRVAPAGIWAYGWL